MPVNRNMTATEVAERHEEKLLMLGPVLERLHNEGTDCYRLFHGSQEGASGLTIDRYGPQLLIQSFHQSLTPAEADFLSRPGSRF